MKKTSKVTKSLSAASAGVLADKDHLEEALRAATYAVKGDPYQGYNLKDRIFYGEARETEPKETTSVQQQEGRWTFGGCGIRSAGSQRLGNVEVKLIETDKRLDTVFDAQGRGRLLPSGIISAKTEFDSIRQVSR